MNFKARTMVLTCCETYTGNRQPQQYPTIKCTLPLRPDQRPEISFAETFACKENKILLIFAFGNNKVKIVCENCI